MSRPHVEQAGQTAHPRPQPAVHAGEQPAWSPRLQCATPRTSTDATGVAAAPLPFFAICAVANPATGCLCTSDAPVERSAGVLGQFASLRRRVARWKRAYLELWARSGKSAPKNCRQPRHSIICSCRQLLGASTSHLQCCRNHGSTSFGNMSCHVGAGCSRWGAGHYCLCMCRRANRRYGPTSIARLLPTDLQAAPEGRGGRGPQQWRRHWTRRVAGARGWQHCHQQRPRRGAGVCRVPPLPPVGRQWFAPLQARVALPTSSSRSRRGRHALPTAPCPDSVVRVHVGGEGGQYESPLAGPERGRYAQYRCPAQKLKLDPLSPLPLPACAPPAASRRPADFAPGTLLGGKYEVLELLGRGSSGVTYRCRNTAGGDGGEVAIKCLSLRR